MAKPKHDAKRDGGRFLALPHDVLKSAAYRALGHVARSLLLDIAVQYNRQNNGKLTACKKYLRPLGWKSADTVGRAKGELLRSGLLIETRKGARPNKAAWYMLAWNDLDIAEGLDSKPETFQRARKDYRIANAAPLVPSRGPAGKPIAPSHGTRDSRAIPSHGAIRAD